MSDEIQNRVQELADKCNVGIKAYSNDLIVMRNSNGVVLGGYQTYNEVYAFLCGYTRSTTAKSEQNNKLAASEGNSYDWAIRKLRNTTSCTAVVTKVDDNVLLVSAFGPDGEPILLDAVVYEEHCVQFIIDAIRVCRIELTNNE